MKRKRGARTLFLIYASGFSKLFLISVVVVVVVVCLFVFFWFCMYPVELLLF